MSYQRGSNSKKICFSLWLAFLWYFHVLLSWPVKFLKSKAIKIHYSFWSETLRLYVYMHNVTIETIINMVILANREDDNRDRLQIAYMDERVIFPSTAWNSFVIFISCFFPSLFHIWSCILLPRVLDVYPRYVNMQAAIFINCVT